MILEQNFLVRYGLHNFVTLAPTGKKTFVIKGMENQNMVSHAKRLIEDTFGGRLDIQSN